MNQMILYGQLRDEQIEFSVSPSPGQKFLPRNIIDKFITEETVRSCLSKTLRNLFHRRLSIKVVEQAPKVFAILVDIGDPDAISELLSEGLRDKHLPLHTTQLARNVLVSQTGEAFRSFANRNAERTVDKFINEQWKVMAPVLDDSGRHTELHHQCPLPFMNKDPFGNNGNMSTVYKSEIHPAHYKGSNLRGDTYRIAAKEFRNEADFWHEKENLETVAKLNHKYLIRHLATFKKGSRCYVIFPWANGGTLKSFWELHDAHVRDKELLLWSLRQILGLSEALEALHSVNCRHGDLKPENILHFKYGGQGRLVIADVGVSKSHKQGTRLRSVGTTTRATTPTYEPPEAFTNDSSTPRARRYDMWSIGCIFLEFTLWLLHDMEAVDSFEKARDAPDFEFYRRIKDTSPSHTSPPIHPRVTQAIERLRKDPRCTGDTIFVALVELIAERLLRVEVEERAFADELVETLRTIVHRAEKDPSRLLNIVPPPDKLRFPKRAPTGIYEPSNDTISE